MSSISLTDWKGLLNGSGGFFILGVNSKTDAQKIAKALNPCGEGLHYSSKITLTYSGDALFLCLSVVFASIGPWHIAAEIGEETGRIIGVSSHSVKFFS